MKVCQREAISKITSLTALIAKILETLYLPHLFRGEEIMLNLIHIVILFFNFHQSGAESAAPLIRKGHCERTQTQVVYQHDIDYQLACQALAQIEQRVITELGYQTDTAVSIEFKEEVLFSMYDLHGQIVSQDPVYGLYDRKRHHIEMSAFYSSIVQNPDREHFSLKIQSLPLSQLKKDQLLKELHLSILIHELTHLFTQHNFKDDNPSPAVHEYFSYVIQIQSLSPELRNLILQKIPDRFTSDLQINSMIHFAAPHPFGVMSYRHFMDLGERKKDFIESALTGQFRPDDLLEIL